MRLGIAHVPEGRGTFSTLTVEENLRLGAYTRRDRPGVAADFERVYGYFPRLKERRRQQAGTLSGGEQQMLAIAPRADAAAAAAAARRAVVRPGAADRAGDLSRSCARINARGAASSMLLVEQNAALALDLADHAYCWRPARVVMSGPAAEIVQNDEACAAPTSATEADTWTHSCTGRSPASPPAASMPAWRWRW